MQMMSDNLDLKIHLQAWRTSLDTQGLRINVGKTKILGSSGEAQKPTRCIKRPSIVCSKGVGVNSILPDLHPLDSLKDARELKEH